MHLALYKTKLFKVPTKVHKTISAVSSYNDVASVDGSNNANHQITTAVPSTEPH